MNDKAYVLWFAKGSETEDAELLIGLYRTPEDAKAAIERLKGKPGFVDFPQGFTMVEYELNVDHWAEGFVAAT